MIILTHEQGSNEWFNSRIGVFTASTADKIITPTGKQSTQSKALAGTKAGEVLSKNREFSPANYYMKKGNAYEPIARKIYREVTDSEVLEVGLALSDCRNIGASVDGAVVDIFGNWIKTIEIKTVNYNSFVQFASMDIMPSKYKPQVQMQMLVTGVKQVDFVFFNEDLGLGILEVKRDESYIAKLKSYLDSAIRQRDEYLTQMILRDNIYIQKSKRVDF